MKLTADRSYADPEKAARRLLEHAQAFEVIPGWRDLYRENQRTVPVRRQGHAGSRLLRSDAGLARTARKRNLRRHWQ